MSLRVPEAVRAAAWVAHRQSGGRGGAVGKETVQQVLGCWHYEQLRAACRGQSGNIASRLQR